MFPTAGLYIEAESLEMHLGQDPEEDITVSGLIEIQRRLANSENLFERLVGVLWAAGMLEERLAYLTDRQIGQLLFDHFGHDLGILQPEITICGHAIRRLFRSAGGKVTAQDIEKQWVRPACPKCGNEMLLHYGIDELDFLECVLLNCGHKRLLNTEKENPSK
jgi:hypothetical protein